MLEVKIISESEAIKKGFTRGPQKTPIYIVTGKINKESGKKEEAEQIEVMDPDTGSKTIVYEKKEYSEVKKKLNIK